MHAEEIGDGQPRALIRVVLRRCTGMRFAPQGISSGGSLHRFRSRNPICAHGEEFVAAMPKAFRVRPGSRWSRLTSCLACPSLSELQSADPSSEGNAACTPVSPPSGKFVDCVRVRILLNLAPFSSAAMLRTTTTQSRNALPPHPTTPNASASRGSSAVGNMFFQPPPSTASLLRPARTSS
jgi:hypothetical protein